jgi:predicted DNA-binding antitoxin AbrB/MazE fold protein
MSDMGGQLKAVYEYGVLRPLQPLGLRDHQHVLVTVSEPADYRAGAKAQLRELGAVAPGLREVQRQVAGIPGSMSDVVIEERRER